LAKGTWHWPPIPVRDFANLVLISKGELFTQTDMVDIGYNVYPVF